jgi:hypothetical protein
LPLEVYNDCIPLIGTLADGSESSLSTQACSVFKWENGQGTFGEIATFKTNGNITAYNGRFYFTYNRGVTNKNYRAYMDYTKPFENGSYGQLVEYTHEDDYTINSVSYLAYLGNNLVIAFYYGSIVYSNDGGKTFTKKSIGFQNPQNFDGIYSITYGNGVYVATTRPYSGSPSAYYSRNGIDWVLLYDSLGFNFHVSFDGKRFYMFYGNTFYVSLDGISWTLKSIPTVFGEEYSNVQYIG